MKTHFTTGLLLLFFSFAEIQGQTVLNRIPLKLEGPVATQQALGFADLPQKNYFLIISDKYKVRLFHYNRAIFLKDSLTFPQPAKEYPILAGYAFNQEQSPVVFWASEDYDRIIGFYYGSHAVLPPFRYKIDYTNQTFLMAFSKNGKFYLLCVADDLPMLRLYAFAQGEPEISSFDFSSYAFAGAKNKNYSLKKFLTEDDFQLMEERMLNPIFAAAAPSKLYVESDRLLLTLDQNPTLTQVFSLSLKDKTVSEQKVPLPDPTNSVVHNSFLMEGHLYQMSSTDSQLKLSRYNLSANARDTLYTATDKDSIAFRNSPLLSQTNARKALVLKNTKKFLNRLSWSQAGLTVYRTPQDILLTIGGNRTAMSTGDLIAASLLTTGGIIGGVDASGAFGQTSSQLVYFDALFDDEFHHKIYEPEMLAIDLISEIMASDADFRLQTVSRFSDYYILGYFDPNVKEYVLRRVVDGNPQ